MEPSSTRIRVGIGGWVYAPWRGVFYPSGLPQRRELEYAAQHVTAIEINGTFYGTQKPETYARWAAQTPEGFLFSAKAPLRIVSARQLAKTGPQIEHFVEGIAALGDRLGLLVWQFDADLQPDRDDFARFLEHLPAEAGGRPLRHVLDLRVPGFVDRELLARIRAHGFALVYTDSPEHPQFADLTADFVYARLMRSQTELPTGYPPEALDAWAARARQWARGEAPADLPCVDPDMPAPVRPRDVFVFFIAAAKARNPAAAMALLERLRG